MASFLKIISSPNLDFYSDWNKGLLKIKELSLFEKSITFFWLLGPFIYLIERTPADFWLSSIGLLFLFRCITKNDWKWAKQLWFRLSLIFWVICLISSILSDDIFFTFSQGFVWIRFPLYVASAQVWLAKDREIRVMMLLMIIIGLIVMSLILIAESIIDPKTRLTWPYGDLIPGTYLAKLCLPAICVSAYVMFNEIKKKTLFSYVFIITLVTTAVILSGERTNFLILGSSLLLIIFLNHFKFKNLIFIIFINVIIFSSIFSFRPDLYNRFTNHFIERIPVINLIIDKSNIMEHSAHWGSWRGGIHQFLKTPFLGVGPSGTRKTCKDIIIEDIKWLPGKNYCGNHPHNFYIQMAAETGIVGLFFGSFLFLSIFLNCFRQFLKEKYCPMRKTAFVIPLAMFFPIQQFGSLFGQWGNLFIWFGVAFAISQVQDWNNKSDYVKNNYN